MTDSEATPTSIDDALRSDHRSITEALDAPGLLDESREGFAAREQLVAELVRHFVAEEQYLYPAMRERLSDGEQRAERSNERDRALEHQLRGLEEATTEARLAELIGTVRTSFAEHVDQQDTDLRDLVAHTDPQTLQELGEGVLGAEQLAPTRPRLVAPESPALNKASSILEGFVDQVRDYYGRRGRD